MNKAELHSLRPQTLKQAISSKTLLVHRLPAERVNLQPPTSVIQLILDTPFINLDSRLAN